MLAVVVAAHWHPLRRDVIALGKDPREMFTPTLPLEDMLSIVLAAPPTSSVRASLDRGWTRTDHLLANIQEGQSGVAELRQPYERPGVNERMEVSNDSMGAQTMAWEEMDQRDAAREELGRQIAAGLVKTGSGVRTI